MSSFDPYVLSASLPFLVLAAGVLLLISFDLVGLLTNEYRRTMVALSFVAAAIACFVPYPLVSAVSLSGQLVMDGFGGILSILILISTGGVILLNHGSLEAQGVERRRDINSLLLIATIGALGLVCSNDLISLFLSLELLSVPLYVLVASARKERGAAEGALKYFLLGAVSSAFLLYGMALIYGVTGTLQISELADRLQGDIVVHPLVAIAVLLMGFGFAFKVSLAPFHFWAPDAYQGAPLSVLGFMSVVVKIAAFGAFVRVFNVSFGAFSSEWTGFIMFIGGISMLIGNLSALRQTSVKRLLAYSSIAHAGYAVVGLPFMQAGGVEALLFYIITYAVTSLGLAAVLIIHLGGSGHQYANDSIPSLRGLSKRDPIAAVAFAVFVLSLAGIPPLAGFFGKFAIISAILRGGYPGVAVFLVLNSVISLGYYLRLMAVVFEEGDEIERTQFALFPSRFVLVSMLVVVAGGAFFVDRLSGVTAQASSALIAPLIESSSF